MISYQVGKKLGASHAEVDHTSAYAEAGRGIVAHPFRMPFVEYSVGGDTGPDLILGEQGKLNLIDPNNIFREDDEDDLVWSSPRRAYVAILCYAVASHALDLSRYNRGPLLQEIRKIEDHLLEKSIKQAYEEHYLTIPRVAPPLEHPVFDWAVRKILVADAERMATHRAFRQAIRQIAGCFITTPKMDALELSDLFDLVFAAESPQQTQELKAISVAEFEELCLKG